MTRRLPDHNARRRAATVLDENVFVVAGAGTGKTSLLVERYLNLLLSGRVPLGEIVAFTFTEKAAAEMKLRVAEALEEVVLATQLLGMEPDSALEAGRSLRWLLETERVDRAELHRRSLSALEHLETAFIGTIHAFCSDVLRRHPREAELPPDFSVDDGVAQDLLFDEIWSEFLAEELGPDPPRPELWIGILAAFPESVIEEVARALTRCPIACDEIGRAGYRPLDPREVYGERARQLRDAVATYRGKVTGKTQMPDLLADELGLLDEFLEGGTERLRELEGKDLLVRDFWERKHTFSGGTGPEKTIIKKTATEAMKLLQKLRGVQEGAFSRLMEALQPLARRFRRRIREDGVLSYDDLLLIVRNLLRDRPEVRRREAVRARAILVDEFQDTDPLQYEIVFLLASADEGRVSDAYSVDLRPGRLFAVGDPKQSIYRFRGADMAAYARAKERILIGGTESTLVTNFRSVPEVIEPLNRLFRDWMGPRFPEERDVEPEFAEIRAARTPGNTDSGVEMWSVLSSRGSSMEQRRQMEASRIAEQIGQWTEKGTYSLREIAVLFRALIDVPIYARELDRAGIDFVVEGGRAYAERPEIIEALALLRALANPADTVATLGVLRSALGGVTDVDLTRFVARNGRLHWSVTAAETMTEGYPTIHIAFERLRRLDRQRRDLPLDRWILWVLTESDFALLQTAFFEGAQRTANLRKLAERAATLSRERGLTLEQTLDVLEGEFTGERVEGESPLADEGLPAVSLLSMHKAKGLEYRVVILPDLARRTPHPQRTTKIDVLRRGGGVYSAVDVKNRMDVQNTASLLWKEERQRHEEAEQKRLLYVATTRAKERLILINTSPRPENRWVEALARHWGYRIEAEGTFPENGELLAGGTVGHRRLEGASDRPPSGSRAPVPDLLPPYRAFEAAQRNAETPRPPRFRNPSTEPHPFSAETVPEEDPEGTAPRSRDLARAVGTAVHRLLENYDFDDPPAIPPRLQRVVREASSEFGLDPEPVGKDVLRVMEAFRRSPLPPLLAGAEILGREVPILYRDPYGITVSGYADLVYRRGETVHVADYKTDETATRERVEAYRAQLTDYGQAIREAMGLEKDPVLEILFVRKGERVVL